MNGSLVITTIKEEYEGRQYTSGYMKSKYAMQFGKIEIRASMPNAKNIRSVFQLVADQVIEGWPNDGQVDMMVYQQDKNVHAGMHYSPMKNGMSGTLSFTEIN